MSSHHVVREKQEPALLILGLDHFDRELLGQLLEWSPTVIVTTAVAEKVDAAGIKIDWLIGDVNMAGLQSDIKVLPALLDSALVSAMKFLVANHYPAVNIIADDFIVNDYLFYADQINLVIFYCGQKIFPVKSGFSKWKPAGEVIELLTAATSVEYSGLAPVGGQRYQTTNDGFFNITFKEKLVFVAETL